MKRKAFSCAVLSIATAMLLPGISLAKPVSTLGQWFNRSGKWYYGKDEENLRKEWIVFEGDWFYLQKDSGELQSGWLNLNGKKYFLNTLHNGQFGKLLTGWQWIDGYCYFFEAEDPKTLGELKVSGLTKDGYRVDENGRYLSNGKVVYEAGKGLPGTESGQSVAGVSRTLPSVSGDSSYRSRSRRSASTGSESTTGSTVSPTLPSKESQSEAKKDSEKQENIEKSSGSQMEKPKEETKPEQPKEDKKPESPKEDKKPEVPKEDTKPETPKEEEKKQSLMDGVYFGTSKEGIHFQEKGPNIVKVRIENGKIVSAESVVFTDDTQPDFFAKFRDRLLERVKGLDSVDEVKKSVNSKSGKYYDGLAGATRTLRSHTSALENALYQAKKQEGREAFPFSHMEFESRPNPSQSGKTLDLSDTRLKLHFPNGETKVVSPEEFAQYGIGTSPAQGSPIKEGTKEILVHFLQKDMDIDLVSAIVPRAEIRKKYPTEIHVHYANGDSSTITLDKENFRYTIPAKGKIDHMHLMDGDKEVARSVYDAAANQWSFSLKNVSHEGFSSWGYELYTVKVDTSKDNSPIASFKLDSRLAKKEYHVGDALKIDDLIVEAVTEQGNNKLYQNWELAKAAGFSSTPENNTSLNTVGDNTVTIRYHKGDTDLSQSFTVNVKDLANQIPAKVEIRTKAGELVKRYSFTQEEWEQSSGGIKRFKQSIPKKFQEAWNTKEFMAKAYNKDGEELTTESTRRGIMFRIEFPNYSSGSFVGTGIFSLSFQFDENAPVEKEENETPKPETPKPDTPKPDTKPENPKEETPKKDEKTSSSTIEKPTPSDTEANDALLPAHVEVYWHGEKVVDNNYNLDEVKKHRGQLIFKGIKVPAKMKGHNKREDFTVVIKNSKGEDLPYTKLDTPYSKSHARIHIELKKRYPEWTPMRIDYVWSYEEDPTETKPSTGDESSVDDLLPSHAEVFWHGEKLVEKDISKEQIQAAKGRLTYDVSIPGKKKRNFTSDYSVVVKNQKGKELPQNHVAWNPDKISSLIVNLKNPHPQWGKMNLTFIWKYEEDTENTTPEDPKKEEESNPAEKPKEETDPSYIKTFYGESEVVPYDYTVKVKVTWDSKAKKIIKVEDNDTFADTNASFWNKVKRTAMPALTGKNRDTVDDIDAVARCTFSRNALVEAVRNAIPEE
ncbi:bacterial Ig-like domain-containing protein [Oribacterium sinus]|uniref:bacterial Ig-like domain-containing protein n=1 Tax=Oribacterium sinus TaxID=237576 RepID=UPI0028E365F6|nr:bacterial Ig-like domain-containing protein [Oribacterium sinus]